MSSSPFNRRTTLITGVCIAAVIVAGALAVSANVGILDATSDSELGTLSAARDLAPPSNPPAEVPGDAPAAPTAQGSQDFLVESAGTVSVDSTGGSLRVGAVVTNPGWTWAADGSAGTDVTVTFTDGARSLVFTAALAEDGSIAAAVDEATPTVTTATAPTGHEAEQEHDDDEHEGRDDDD